MTILLSILLLLHLCVIAAVLIFHLLKRSESPALQGPLPRISVLVAARNEEANVLSCLESLACLDYPADLLDIWIGNDGSEDRTEQIIRGFIADKPHFHLLNITATLGLARGKSNVLAHLTHQAQGEYFFVTDADCRVSPQWIRAHLSELRQGEVFCSGTTVVEGRGLFARMQGLEWLYLNLFWNAADAIYPISAIGNNMAFPANAYWKTGGYENHPFSLTEDYQLFRLLQAQGLRHRHILSPECMAFSAPLANYQMLLHQRKRWLRGGESMRWWVWCLLAVYSLFLPLLFILALISPLAASLIILLKIGLDSALFQVGAKRLRRRYDLLDVLLFTHYLLISNVLIFVDFFQTRPVKWKGRTYGAAPDSNVKVK